MASQVTAPDGRVWHVSRRVTPRLGNESVWGRFRRRYSNVVDRTGNVADADPGFLDVFGDGIAVGIAVILAVVVLFFVIVPLLVAIVDLLVVLVLGLVGIALRIALRRPWTVEATSTTGDVARWRVVGWRASGAKVAEVAALLESGARPDADWSSLGGAAVKAVDTREAADEVVTRTVPSSPSPRMSRAVIVAWVIIGVVGVAIAVTIRQVIDTPPSYQPPCSELRRTGCVEPPPRIQFTPMRNGATPRVGVAGHRAVSQPEIVSQRFR